MRSNCLPLECQMQLNTSNVSGAGIEEWNGGESYKGALRWGGGAGEDVWSGGSDGPTQSQRKRGSRAIPTAFGRSKPRAWKASRRNPCSLLPSSTSLFLSSPPCPKAAFGWILCSAHWHRHSRLSQESPPSAFLVLSVQEPSCGSRGNAPPVDASWNS